MSYPNIVQDVNNHENILNGQTSLTNVLKFNKSYNVINIINPEVSDNKNRLQSASQSQYFADSGIVAFATNGDVLGQLVIGRQQTIADSGSMLGNCILEHFNGETWANIVVGHNTDGNKFLTTNATLPAITDSSSNVATTQWVKSCIPLNLKAYGCWGFTQLTKSYNCVMTETSAGTYRISFLTPMSSTDYFVFAIAECDGAGKEIIGCYNYNTTYFNLDVTGYDGALNALGSTMIRFFVWE
jgi:hypothetical protein